MVPEAVSVARAARRTPRAGGPTRPVDRRRLAPGSDPELGHALRWWPDRCVLLAALVSMAAVAAALRWGSDWPAQEFRAWTAGSAGLTAWTNRWYNGQALPGYSVTYPLLAGPLGAGLTGLLAVAVATAGAARLAPRGGRARAVGYLTSVVVVLTADLTIGQVPYLLGVASGVWTLWAVRTRRPWPAAALAALCSLSSPLAGSFVLLVIPAVACALGWRRAVPLLGALTGVGVSVVLGGAGGPFPFTSRTLIETMTFATLAVVLPRRGTSGGELVVVRSIRVLGMTYGAASVVLYLVADPIGGNLARLGQLCALPLVWHALPVLRARRHPAAPVAVPLAVPLLAPLVALAALWPVWPAASGVARSARDPSQHAAYFAGLQRFLRHQDPTTSRLEVVFTREHWEASWVARNYPIARGWERQTDLAENPALYRPLTAAGYRRWLDDNAISLVALPDVPIDYGGRAEAALLRRPPPYLRLVWHDRHIRVWRVLSPEPLISGPVDLHSLGAASMVIDFHRAGRATVRIRASSLWSISAGTAQLSSNTSGWLTVTSPAAGAVTLRARVTLNPVLSLLGV